MFYAYLEKKNFQSSKLVTNLGFEPVRDTSTYGFSRFFPKQDPRVVRVTKEDHKKNVLDLLVNFYQDHCMVNFTSIHNHDNYFVVKENDEIIAGVQAVPSKWVVQKMEGWSGKFIMKVVPKIPLINQLFNPEDFNFVGFEGIYFKKGREADLILLFEHVLAVLNLKSGLFWQDVNCPYNLKDQRLGLINKFVAGTGSSLMISFNKLSEEDQQLIRSRPAYISCFDFV
jgi:hypothetical protein